MAEIGICAYPRGDYLEGDILAVRANGHPWSRMMSPPHYMIVKIPDWSLASASYLQERYHQTINIAVVRYNENKDEYTFEVSCGNPGSSGIGNVTQEQVEKYVAQWKGEVVASNVNRIQVKASIAEMATSSMMHGIQEKPVQWGKLQFEELSYNKNTGSHILRCNYSNGDWNPTTMETIFGFKSTVLSHVGSVIEFEIMRDVAFEYVNFYWQNSISSLVSKRRWRVSESVVDTIEAQGGYVTTDQPTFLGWLINKEND